MPETLLSVQSATKRFGDVVALDSVDLDIHQGDIVGLVGSNGAGKSTLLKIMPWFSTPGKIFTLEILPVCKPFPEKFN